MQGFNMGRYVPPDQEGLTTGNKLAGKHPLGARARHLRTTGALIVRFEMPFAVWCTTCKPHETIIGQGVRFNAEKKKIGNYYSTPIYSFRMKHPQCGGWIEIQTDPKNTAYVVTEGGRKRDTGEDREAQPGEITIRLGAGSGVDPAVSQDPFARVEVKTEDKRRVDTERERILELQKRQERDWDDPYAMSRRLRKTFRADRKLREGAEMKTEALKDKMSLGIELVDETEEDRVQAAMVEFDAVDGSRRARIRPMFEPRPSSSAPSSSPATGLAPSVSSGIGQKGGKSKRPKTADLLAERKALFRSELTGNTRAAIDPFLNNDIGSWQPEGKKRKIVSKTFETIRSDPDVVEAERGGSLTTPSDLAAEKGTREHTQSTPLALVNYGSESD